MSRVMKNRKMRPLLGGSSKKCSPALVRVRLVIERGKSRDNGSPAKAPVATATEERDGETWSEH